MRGALLRYRVIAWVVGVFLLLLTFGVVVRYTDWLGFRTDVVSRTVSPVHGFGYMLYLAAGLDLAFRARWGIWRTLGVLLAGTVPLLSFVAERSVAREVGALLADEADAGPPPAGEAADRAPEPGQPDDAGPLSGGDGPGEPVDGGAGRPGTAASSR